MAQGLELRRLGLRLQALGSIRPNLKRPSRARPYGADHGHHPPGYPVRLPLPPAEPGARGPVATLSLALGIAVNVTLFAAVDILLLRPLPFEDPDRLVQFWSTNPSRGWDQTSISLADFRDWRAQSRLPRSWRRIGARISTSQTIRSLPSG